MTRLVGVRAICDGCSAAAAVLFCVSHRHVLCPPCDLAQHNSQSTAPHQRVNLSSAVTALPFCEHCDDAPATTYCETESSTLCDKCDANVHKNFAIPHWRTPIEKTLKSRAAEFRVSSRPRQTGRPRPSQVASVNSSRQRALSQEKRDNGKDPPTPKPQAQGPRLVPSATSPIHQGPSTSSAVSSRPPSVPVSCAQSKQPTTARGQNSQALPQRQAGALSSAAAQILSARHSSTQQRRRPRPLAKRKREMQRLSQQMQNFRPLDVPFSRTDVLPTDDFFACDPIARISQPFPYSSQPDFSTQQHSQPPAPLQDPLLVDPHSRYLDLDMLPYENIDRSGEATALEGINGSGRSASVSGSAAESGASSLRRTPEIDTLEETRAPRNTPTQVALREMMASAVAAAGEQYILNSVSSGSGSSQDGEAPRMTMSCAPDPAGLVAAATAAAASAAAQVAAGVDLSNQELKTSSQLFATDTTWEGLSGRIGMRQPRISLRVSEGGIPSARDMAKAEAAREAISDEVLRSVETDSRRTKQENVMNVDNGDGNTYLVAQLSDGDDVLRRGEEMGYLDISRDDFGGVFDSIDLSQFEQNGSGGLGFGMGDFRPILDSDEG